METPRWGPEGAPGLPPQSHGHGTRAISIAQEPRFQPLPRGSLHGRAGPYLFFHLKWPKGASLIFYFKSSTIKTLEGLELQLS